MKSASKCECVTNAGVSLERPRYFPRQLITPIELTLEQDYFRDKLRRHNRLLHGWGVVCGAKVCYVIGDGEAPEPWKVCVSPGYILGPYGDEIVIDECLTIDLRKDNGANAKGDALDPWCSEVYRKPTIGGLYVAVQYCETPTRPVHIQPVGCGCDESPCEFSRFRDGYAVGLLTELPASHTPEPPSFNSMISGDLPDCPPCPSDPWVVLAYVPVDENGTVGNIDNCRHRRLVASFARFWWQCTRVSPVLPP